ncbi:MAG: YceG family protein [Culicoidibacterales bacterium]
MNLKQSLSAIYRKRYERENQYQTCEPYFQRIIGIDDESQYYDLLYTLQEYCKEHQKITVFFEGQIPMQAEFALIENVKTELATMDVTRLSQQEITISPSPTVNAQFLAALEAVVQLALSQEQFFSEFVRNDFIAKLIVWAYSYFAAIDFEGHYLPKCIYYGTISKHEIYFLMLIYKMGVDVLYLNPLKEELFASVDTKGWSQLQQEMGVVAIETFAEKAKRGTLVTNFETTTKLIQNEIHDAFFDQTGMYKPWQFREGYTCSLTLESILEDVYVYWDQEARMRQHFKTVGQTVYVPSFFYKIDGVYEDRLKYKRLLDCCTQAPNTLFYTTGTFMRTEIILDEMYQVMFCQLSDGTFDPAEVKKLPFYRFGKYNETVQDFILKKYNEFIQNEQLFQVQLTNEQKMQLLYLVLMMDETLIRAIDNFDFTKAVPKIVIYLEHETGIPDELVRLLAYFKLIGFDLMIFNPSGLFNLEKILAKEIVSTKRLEKMDYTSTYAEASKHKQSLFAKFIR